VGAVGVVGALTLQLTSVCVLKLYDLTLQVGAVGVVGARTLKLKVRFSGENNHKVGQLHNNRALCNGFVHQPPQPLP
jgi:hypothetical protein